MPLSERSELQHLVGDVAFKGPTCFSLEVLGFEHRGWG